jgi:hypothetical protein
MPLEVTTTSYALLCISEISNNKEDARTCEATDALFPLSFSGNKFGEGVEIICSAQEYNIFIEYEISWQQWEFF